MSSGTDVRQRSRQVGVRLTEEEFEHLERWADAWLISIPELLRCVTFGSAFAAEFTGEARHG